MLTITFFLCFSFSFLIAILYFLFIAAITQTLNPTEAFAVPTGIAINEPKPEIETHTVPAETKISFSM